MRSRPLLSAAIAILVIGSAAPCSAQHDPKWSLGLRGGFDAMEYKGQATNGAIWGSARYSILPAMSLILETGFNRYGRRWHDSQQTRRVTEIIPISAGFRLHPATGNGSRPFLQVLPTLFRGHVIERTESQSLIEGVRMTREEEYRSSGWTPGIQFDAGFEFAPNEPRRLEFGIRMMITGDEVYSGIFEPLTSSRKSGTRYVYESNNLELDGFHNVVVYGGISFDI